MKSRFSEVKLHQVITPVERPEEPVAGRAYRQIGVRLWGQGAYERETIDGAQTKYPRFNRTMTDDVILNKIWARNGSVAVVTPELEGTYASTEFPLFAPNREMIDPAWIRWLLKTSQFWTKCDEKSQGTSGKNRIRPDQFLEIEIPLPPLAEQRRIVARLAALAAKIVETQALHVKQAAKEQALLHSTFAKITANAPLQPMSEIAPLVRRPVEIDPSATYPELGIRSFGKGTFHKPALSGVDIGTKRIFQIEPGDLLFSNVFAWEGAIAVATPEDAGRYGSHRFISCVPQANIATAEFLRFYFLTPAGFTAIGEASPGGAGRNRTLSLTKLASLSVPIPSLSQQQWFDRVQTRIHQAGVLRAVISKKFASLDNALLHRAFAGEL
jgi:type I restriction enzyme S subunit